jgi:rhamnose transport system ATP-binding protein
MGGLSIADQQMVEIASALSQDARVIIMDEPTAALTPVETDTLFRIIRQLRGEGRTVIFISHRLEEVRGIADRVTILRDGRHVHTSAIAAVNDDDIIRHMIGRPLKEYIHKQTGSIGSVMLRVRDLSLDRIFQHVSFELRAGEIVGMAGLVGAGRTDVAKAIFGASAGRTGSIEVAGHPVVIRSPADAIRHGIAYVPEDRAEMGIFRELSVEQNVTAAIPDRIARRGILRPAKERELVEEYVAKLSIRLASIRQPMGELSGGNQQKAILARWLLTNPRILILDEPTRGIDVGVKAEVYDIMNRLAQAGTAILLISSELTEVLTLSDRILVMCEGALTAELSRETATQEAVMRAAVPRSARAA